jgi:hypothetical protein
VTPDTGLPSEKAVERYEGTCPRCGSPHWTGVSLNGGYTRIPQCVPCGAYHQHTLGPGWRAEYERRGHEIRCAKETPDA